MNYAIVDLAWAKSHGIEILPEYRTSVDQTKVILHEEMLVPYIDEDFPRYRFGDPSFIELLNSAEWSYAEGEAPEVNREFSRLLALDLLDKEATEEINTYELTKEEALQVKHRYPEWSTGLDVKVGEKYQYQDELWEVVQEHTTQLGWEPSLETASLWKRIDEEHAGTLEDPIPYAAPMELFNGKYYIENEIIYLCNRDSGIPLSQTLAELVGLYVEVVNQE